MREIHQASYNTDQLSMEVIDAIADLLKEKGAWSDGLMNQFTNDYIEFLNHEKYGVTQEDVPMDEIEDGWKDLAAEYDIEVYDDGEAGWTYVGSSEEIHNLLVDNEL